MILSFRVCRGKSLIHILSIKKTQLDSIEEKITFKFYRGKASFEFCREKALFEFQEKNSFTFLSIKMLMN